MINWTFVDESGSDLNKYIIQHLDDIGNVLGEETVKLLRDATITQPGTPLTAVKLNEMITKINNKVDKVANSRLITETEATQITTNATNISKKVDKVSGSRLITETEATQINTNKTNIGNLQSNKVDKVADKSLVADSEITKLASVEAGAQKNIIEKITINNGNPLPIVDKKINITIPTKLPNPNKLTFQVNSQNIGTYDGSSEQTFNITTEHTHDETDIILSVATVTTAEMYSYAYPKGKTIFVNLSTLSQFMIYPDGHNGVTHERGTEIALFRIGTGDVEIKAVTVDGTTPQILSYGGKKFINAQHQAVMLIKDTANTWRLFGALKS